MKDNYLPQRTVVSVAGNFKEDFLLEELEKRFGSWNRPTIITTSYQRSIKGVLK